jgi:flagellar protein FliL
MPEEDFEQSESYETSAPPPKKKSSKLVLFLIPVLLMQAVGAYYLVMKYVRPIMPEKEAEVVEEVVEENKEDYGLEYVLENMTANVIDGKRSRFLVFNATMETVEQGAVDEMSKRDRQLKALFLSEIVLFPMDMLMDVTRRDTIGEKMRLKVNDILINGAVKKIYFDQWIVN